MATVSIPALAGKQVNLPHPGNEGEGGLIGFDENGEAFAIGKEFVADENGRSEQIVDGEEVKGNWEATQNPLSDAQAAGLVQHYRPFGIVTDAASDEEE